MIVKLKIESVYEDHDKFYNSEFDDKFLLNESDYLLQNLNIDTFISEIIARNNLMINPGYFEDIGEYNLLSCLKLNWLQNVKPALINNCIPSDFVFVLMNKIKDRKVFIDRAVIKKYYSNVKDSPELNNIINTIYKKLYVYYTYKKNALYEFLKLSYRTNESIQCQIFQFTNHLDNQIDGNK